MEKSPRFMFPSIVLVFALRLMFTILVRYHQVLLTPRCWERRAFSRAVEGA